MSTKSFRSGRWVTISIVLTMGIVTVTVPTRAQNTATSSNAASSSDEKPRMEKDLLGEKQIPADAYYGVQTARALENFQISGVPINHYPGFVEAWAIVKLAAAQANTDVGAMKPERLAAIEKAAQAVLDGKYHDQFMVDWYQGGAGTSTNMNANEVLANIGLELTGHKKGEYQFLEPHDDLNMSQSTNDSYPTAIKVALILRNDKLIAELQKLVGVIPREGQRLPRDREDGPHRVAGRGADDGRPGVPRLRRVARWRDRRASRKRRSRCTPSTWAPPRSAPASMCRRAMPKKCAAASGEAHRQADRAGPRHVCRDMGPAGIRGLFRCAEERCHQAFEDRQRPDPADLRTARRLVRDQSAGAAAGSSIMPGKVNPVVPEVMNLVTFRVMGNDFVTTLGCPLGPASAQRLRAGRRLAMMESQHLLYNTSMLFRTKCVDGITVNEKVLAHYMETTVGIVTALNPVVGYEKATELAQEAYKSGKGILEIIREKHVLTEEQIKDLLDPVKLTNLDKSKYQTQ